MLTTFDIFTVNHPIKFDSETVERLSVYNKNYNLYYNKFDLAFAEAYRKLQERYTPDKTTPQTMIKVNLFRCLTDFYKNLLTSEGIEIKGNESIQNKIDEILIDNNFINVIKENYVDLSRYGNGLFKVALVDNIPKIYAVTPTVWHPVCKNGDINNIEGYILAYTFTRQGKTTKEEQLLQVEKHYKGRVENSLYLYDGKSVKQTLDIKAELGLEEIQDFSDKWDDFLIFPVRNTSESDTYFGTSDYINVTSIVEDIVLTVSQNSKIINRHANPKLTGPDTAIDIDPYTGKKVLNDTDFLASDKDEVPYSYLTTDLQAEAIKSHIDTLLQFFFMSTKTPPQAYGQDLSGNLSGVSLRRIFMGAMARLDDIRTSSLNSAIKNTLRCALHLSGNKYKDDISIRWGDGIPDEPQEVSQKSIQEFNAGVSSLHRVIEKINPTYSTEKIEEEISLIQKEQFQEENQGE